MIHPDDPPYANFEANVYSKCTEEDLKTIEAALK